MKVSACTRSWALAALRGCLGGERDVQYMMYAPLMLISMWENELSNCQSKLADGVEFIWVFGLSLVR